MNRRKFLTALGEGAAALSFAPPGRARDLSPVGEFRQPEPIGSPVLDSILPVIQRSRHVLTDVGKIKEHAGWLAYEELPIPQFTLPFDLEGDARRTINFIMVATTLNFAFTDFETGVKFQVDYAGRHWSDSMALFACLKRALDERIPFLDGHYLQSMEEADLRHIFRGNIEIPLIDARVRILRSVGTTLAKKYDGHFYNFIQAAPPRLYANGEGLLERLTGEFPRFNDVSPYDGLEVKFYKLAQLGVWMLYSAVPREEFPLDDPARLTAFADYILPVALRVMNVLRYTPALEKKIQRGELLPAHSAEEIEIRAHTLYATALLREEVNQRRPPDRPVIIPQIDARLWSHYHTTFYPHHLTRTIMY